MTNTPEETISSTRTVVNLNGCLPSIWQLLAFPVLLIGAGLLAWLAS